MNEKLLNDGKKPVGRPKGDSEKKKHFTLIITPSMLTRLKKAAGQIQADTGEQCTISSLINGLAEKYLSEYIQDLRQSSDIQ